MVATPRSRTRRRSSHRARCWSPEGSAESGGGRFRALRSRQPGRWTPTQSLSQARHLHTANLLPSGKVLVAGGVQGTRHPLERRDLRPGDRPVGRDRRDERRRAGHSGHAPVIGPGAGRGGANGQSCLQIRRTVRRRRGNMGSGRGAADRHLGSPHGDAPADRGRSSSRAARTAPSASRAPPCTIRPPGPGRATPDMLAARSEHTATLLSSGRLLVAGGHDPGGPPLAGAELYDPTARTWTSTAAMKNARESHTATLLHRATCWSPADSARRVRWPLRSCMTRRPGSGPRRRASALRAWGTRRRSNLRAGFWWRAAPSPGARSPRVSRPTIP